MKKLGERIKKRRNQLELSLMELAKKIDVTSSLLSQIENGKAYPSIVTLKSIADAINVTVSELIGENETCVNNPVIQKTARKLVKINHQNASLHTTPQNPFYHDFEVFYMTLKKEGKLTLTGFGTFEVVKRAKRKGRNPQTGEPITIKAHKVVKFKPGKGLRDKIK